MKFVTNTLAPLTFSNMSDLQEALYANLPVYLDPAVNFPSFVVPLVLSLVLLLVVAVFVCKSLGLSTFLKSLLKRNQTVQDPSG